MIKNFYDNNTQFLDKYSFLFDRQLGMFITLNGQLLLTMFMEMMSEVGYSINCNTDGIISMIKRDKIERYYEICKEWETLTSLELEHETYEKYISYDINNFIGLTTAGESKCKGRFEFKPMLEQKVNVLHKNKSELIVAKAIHDYFVKGISIEDTIYNHTNIFDFCIGERSQWDSHFDSIEIKSIPHYKDEEKLQYILKKGYSSYYNNTWVKGSDTSGDTLNNIFEREITKDNYINRERLPKTIRYYISNKGKVFKKVYDDGREQFCVVHPQKGRTYNQTLFNKIIVKDIKEYDIDYSYYLKQARKEIDVFKANQTSLL
jgi:hypothetical protein